MRSDRVVVAGDRDDLARVRRGDSGAGQCSASCWLPVTPKSPARMTGSSSTKSASDEMIGSVRVDDRSRRRSRGSAPSSPTRGAVGQVRAEVRERVVERGRVAVVVLLALGEGEELRELGAAPVVGGRGERAWRRRSRTAQEERAECGDDADAGDRHGGEQLSAAAARAKQPQDKRHEEHRPQPERKAADDGAPGGVSPGPRESSSRLVAIASRCLERPLAVKRADLDVELERRVEGVRADPPVGDRHVGVDDAERCPRTTSNATRPSAVSDSSARRPASPGPSPPARARWRQGFRRPKGYAACHSPSLTASAAGQLARKVHRERVLHRPVEALRRLCCDQAVHDGLVG